MFAVRCRMSFQATTTAAAALLIAGSLLAEPASVLNDAVRDWSHQTLEVHGEVRARAERRDNMGFGRDGLQFAEFVRTRVGLTWKPKAWLRVSAMGQDARAPLLGKPAPDSMRDPFDLQESWVELFGKRKTGLVVTAGRQMLNYGDTRLIGSPQWGYTARTWDMARMEWRFRKGRVEALLLSPVRTRGAEFNRPVFGDHIVGVYSAWTGLPGNALTGRIDIDVYGLRHDQNRIGGFTGPGRMKTDSFGVRWRSRVHDHLRFGFEAIGQTGTVGNAPHRASAWVTEGSYQTSVLGRTVQCSAEYKYASGSREPGRSGTFDALYPAAHDKIGHEDLLGWRNIRNVKATASWAVAHGMALTLMFNDSWLASSTDGVYNTAGKLIVKPLAGGATGTHIGREADAFVTWKHGGVTLGGGMGRFFTGDFLKATTPGMQQSLLYVFQTYSF